MLDEQFDVMADPVRRQVMCALMKQPDDDLVVPDDIHEGSRSAEALRIELYHQHLPKLEERDYIQWEQPADRVDQDPRFSDIRPLLSVIETHADELPHDWP